MGRKDDIITDIWRSEPYKENSVPLFYPKIFEGFNCTINVKVLNNDDADADNDNVHLSTLHQHYVFVHPPVTCKIMIDASL